MKSGQLAPPIAAIVLISLGGLLLHLRLHPISFDPAEPSNPALFLPLAAGVLSVAVTPILLAFPRTFVAGYLWNGMSVVVGAITMTALSVSSPPSPLSAGTILLGTMLPSVLLLLSKLFLGEIVLRRYHPGGMGRFFTAWWWIRHFVYLSVVFSIGRLAWR